MKGEIRNPKSEIRPAARVRQRGHKLNGEDAKGLLPVFPSSLLIRNSEFGFLP